MTKYFKIISPNKELYGNIHNMGHVLIAYAHDPDARHLEHFGVIGDVSRVIVIIIKSL